MLLILRKIYEISNKLVELLKFEGLDGKSDTIHTNIQINGPTLAWSYEYVWEITVEIFSYTGSPRVKISQKSFRGTTF